MRDANLQVNEKNSLTNPPSCILPSFSKNASQLLLPKRLLKVCEQKNFQEKRAKSSVTSNLPVELRFIWSQLPSFWIWYSALSWVRFLSRKLEFIAIHYKDKKTFFFSQPVFWYVVVFDKKLIVLHHGDILSYSVLISSSNTHFQQ